MLFSNVFDSVTRSFRIGIRCGYKMANFILAGRRRLQHPRDEIDCLPNAEFVHHNVVHTDLWLLNLARTSR